MNEYVADNTGFYRGINEGRQAARDVDAFLMQRPTLLPKTGGIVARAPYEQTGRPAVAAS